MSVSPCLVDGEAAEALDEKFREVWLEQTGEELVAAGAAAEAAAAAAEAAAGAEAAAAAAAAAAIAFAEKVERASGPVEMAPSSVCSASEYNSEEEEEEESEEEEEEEEEEAAASVPADADAGAEEAAAGLVQTTQHPLEASGELNWHARDVRFVPVMSRPGSQGEDSVLRAVIGLIDSAQEELLMSMGFAAWAYTRPLLCSS
jgi:hypothetical protein